jgi:hypothetical protein
MTENHQYWYTMECASCGELSKFETTEERNNYAAKHMHFGGITLSQLFK